MRWVSVWFTPGNHLNSGEHNILQAGRVPGFHQGDDVRQAPADIGGLYITDLAQCTDHIGACSLVPR
jgi:hypothetical protein